VVADQVRTIQSWLTERNRQPQRNVWRVEGTAILEKLPAPVLNSKK